MSTSLFSYCGHSASHWQQSRYLCMCTVHTYSYVYSAHIQCVCTESTVCTVQYKHATSRKRVPPTLRTRGCDGRGKHALLIGRSLPSVVTHSGDEPPTATRRPHEPRTPTPVADTGAPPSRLVLSRPRLRREPPRRRSACCLGRGSLGVSAAAMPATPRPRQRWGVSAGCLGHAGPPAFSGDGSSLVLWRRPGCAQPPQHRVGASTAAVDTRGSAASLGWWGERPPPIPRTAASPSRPKPPGLPVSHPLPPPARLREGDRPPPRHDPTTLTRKRDHHPPPPPSCVAAHAASSRAARRAPPMFPPASSR